MLDEGATAARRWRALALAAVVVGCNSEPPALGLPPSQPGAAGLERTCQDQARGFGDPAAAYAAYAQAVNEHAWCRAANTFATEARPKLASMTFKGLALTAGSQNHPRHRAYLERFRRLCAKYALACDSEERASELSANLLNGNPIGAVESRLAVISTSMPEDFYGDAMSILADVDPAAIRALDPQLYDLSQQVDRATGVGKLRDGRANPMRFRKRETGWLLDLR
jgi:hypothetical protein